MADERFGLRERWIGWIDPGDCLEVWACFVEFIAMECDDSKTKMSMRIISRLHEHAPKDAASLIEVGIGGGVEEGDCMVDTKRPRPRVDAASRGECLRSGRKIELSHETDGTVGQPKDFISTFWGNRTVIVRRL
jgi:hypothetical protein